VDSVHIGRYGGRMNKLTPFLWFDDQLEEAMAFYTAIFPDGEIVDAQNFGDQVMTGRWRVAGQEFMGMNAGPQHPPTPAFSIWVDCVDQAEVDHYWEALLEGGGREDRCGWLQDRFGVSWQIVPRRLAELMTDADPARAQRAMNEMLTQRKIDVAALERAADAA
jgi:predicted 3-demethylubiquinone-9 3-methyltransferase (glyoxalase superfamily)